MTDEEFDDLFESWQDRAERAWCGDEKPESDEKEEP